MEELPAGEVRVWLTRPERLDDAALASAAALLSPAERARHERLRFPRHRREYLVAHALARTSLSRYAAVKPEAWEFMENENGRPELRGPRGAPPLRFNLSHTAGLVAFALVRERAVGVDVEATTRVSHSLEIADRYFAAEERSRLHGLPRSEQRERFLELWTLKEAYAKAKGEGLGIPLERMGFEVGAGGTVRARFAPELGDDPAHWQFVLQRPGSGHQLALAVHRGEGPELTVHIAETATLASG